jgi:AraC-like DNA-binding protein
VKRNSPRGSPRNRAVTAPEFFSTEVVEARRFYLNLNPPAKQPLAVVCGGVETCKPDYAIHRTTFPFYSVEYVARGHGQVKLAGRLHLLMPGRIFSYGPGVRHDIQSDPADPLVKYFVDFTGGAALKLMQSARIPPGRVAQVYPPHEVQGLFDELLACGIKGTRHSMELCTRLVECLLLRIAASRAPVESYKSRAFQTYLDCRHHVQAHYLRLKTLEEIARECHADAAYVCRLFRRYHHQSPYQFLLRLKMNAAAELLKSPDALVKQVAQQIGFGDAFHFSRTFKAAFGLSPDAFRRLR